MAFVVSHRSVVSYYFKFLPDSVISGFDTVSLNVLLTCTFLVYLLSCESVT